MPAETPTPALERARVAGLPRRLAIILYDLLLVVCVVVVAAALVVIPVVSLGGTLTTGWPRLAFQGYLLAVFVLYFAYFWSGARQTLGMRAWRTLLLRDDGAPLTMVDALRRLGWATVTLAPAGLGLWSLLVDRDGLCWYDRLSGTRPVLIARPGRRGGPSAGPPGGHRGGTEEN